ncbi:dienelactone hydrolase family protein [Dehalogenimonas etheniformans]|uniref:Hydrolase n=1 Tax=Dehalogenimonas etheniformans TaxID=1536648 RepID=A0A2P5P5Y9_9CHLR|nr:dienelactone hydrolase family protein [Dehalogenimonas etheniformans]PPD57716.1 hydrolase [Dehalogenimonas etheniformans]QNT76054.1 dienelactone hydrolase family protein [Dehalogenimonas etheniformans]
MASDGVCPVKIKVDKVTLNGDLCLPRGVDGLVVFAHGSGSSRLSPRNRRVSAALRNTGLGTLLFDLLTEDEEAVDNITGELRFNIRFLAQRLVAVTEWLEKQPEVCKFPIGYFGASTGAAAALVAAAELPGCISAVVSRGGRPDLAMKRLKEVKAPTLLIVGGADTEVLQLNRRAMERLETARELAVVPGATHLFEEPGTMEEVERLAAAWFLKYLTAGRGRS